MYHNLEVRIHSELADLGICHSSAIQLWYLARAIDQLGSGKATISIQGAADTLEKSRLTIKRYLDKALDLGFFRAIEEHWNRNKLEAVTVYYESLHNVGLRHKLDRLGTFAEVLASDLKHLKIWATQLTAQALQASSRWAAKLNLTEQQKQLLIEPEEVISPSSSSSSQGASEGKESQKPKPIKKKDKAFKVVHRGSRFTFVGESFISYGVSQEHIAKTTGRHKSTIQRRLDNRTRVKRGVNPLPRKQLAKAIVDGGTTFVAISQFAGEFDSVALDHVFVCSGGVWQYGCNIYAKQFHIRSGKACKYRYNRKASARSAESPVGD